MPRLDCEFTNIDGWLWARPASEGTYWRKVSSWVEPINVLFDRRENLWGLQLRASREDGTPFTFELEAADFFSLHTSRVEQVFARFGLQVEKINFLINYLRNTLPLGEPIDWGFVYEDGWDAANRFFFQQRLKLLKRASTLTEQ